MLPVWESFESGHSVGVLGILGALKRFVGLPRTKARTPEEIPFMAPQDGETVDEHPW